MSYANTSSFVENKKKLINHNDKESTVNVVMKIYFIECSKIALKIYNHNKL